MRRARAYLTFAAIILATGTAGATGPITKGPWIQKVTPTSAIIRVEVDPPTPVTVELGIGSAGSDPSRARVLESKETRALHSIVVDKLDPATRYAFTVRAGGAQKYGAVTTAPEDPLAPFRFLVFGDNRTDDAAHAAVVRAMASASADFFVHTGDFVANGGSAPEWQTFFDIEAPIMRDRCVFSCVGNHELVDGAGMQYVRYFGPADGPAPVTVTPESLNGSFRWGNARFFLVNGMVSYAAGQASRDWLEKALASAADEKGIVWRIVVTHHGPWSSGPHGDNTRFRDAGIPDLLRKHKVDLVLAGHDHIYERGFADGLAYFVSGGGGAPVYKVKTKSPFSRRTESVRHFIEASVSAVAIQFAATRPDGTVIERCGLRKGEGWDCDGAPASAASGPGGASSGGSSGSAGGSTGGSKCGCRVVGGNGAERGEEPSGPLAGPTWVVLAFGLAMSLVARRRRAILDEGA